MTKLPDLRTREGQEADVLREVRDYGGFSVFWATEYQRRAQAIDRLIARGVIKSAGGYYPYCRYRIVEESKRRESE